MRFRDRTDAGNQLAEKLAGVDLTDPLILGIPRGGVVIAAVIARALGADLDVVLSRKLPTPGQPELALGAVSEDGHVVINPDVAAMVHFEEDELDVIRRHEEAEIARRRQLFRGGADRAPVEGRSVIVTDDGIATGATMIAALQELRTRNPKVLILAVPVAATSRLAEVSRWADRTVCLYDTEDFYAVGQFYDDFRQVEDAEVVETLRGA
ncbi:phosphoribosyltransferase [bacterium]|nr:phosphoribosyltransferase [bacterium]